MDAATTLEVDFSAEVQAQQPRTQREGARSGCGRPTAHQKKRVREIQNIEKRLKHGVKNLRTRANLRSILSKLRARRDKWEKKHCVSLDE